MKKIGLVGGTGPESTLMYYKILNREIDRLTDGKAMPDLAIESVDFRRAWDYVTKGETDLLFDYLREKVECLRKGGADYISLTAVTMHVVFDELVRATNVPMVSIPTAVCNEVVSKGCKKVALLGTVFTMEQDFMKKDLREAGVEVVVPDAFERQLIGRRIYEELEQGIVKDSTREELLQIIRRMMETEDIDGVILGCTELPLILSYSNCPVRCFNAVEIHINGLIQLAMQ